VLSGIVEQVVRHANALYRHTGKFCSLEAFYRATSTLQENLPGCLWLFGSGRIDPEAVPPIPTHSADWHVGLLSEFSSEHLSLPSLDPVSDEA